MTKDETNQAYINNLCEEIEMLLLGDELTFEEKHSLACEVLEIIYSNNKEDRDEF